MNEGTANVAGNELRLSAALLLYSCRNVVGRGEYHYATVHGIAEDESHGRPVIGAGQPLTRDALTNAMRTLAENVAPKAEFLPATVLSVSLNAVTWWCPPALRRVFFDCPEIGCRSAVVPHPGLVFQAWNGGFRVFAVNVAERPTEETPLFEPPYFNTWNDGLICIGSAQVPKRIDVSSIAEWEAGFFESAFTHPNGGGKRVAYQNGEFAFWKAMLDGKFKQAFPLECLVPTDYTAGELAVGAIGERQ